MHGLKVFRRHLRNPIIEVGAKSGVRVGYSVISPASADAGEVSRVIRIRPFQTKWIGAHPGSVRAVFVHQSSAACHPAVMDIIYGDGSSRRRRRHEGASDNARGVIDTALCLRDVVGGWAAK